jgi:hypothetical protein
MRERNTMAIMSDSARYSSQSGAKSVYPSASSRAGKVETSRDAVAGQLSTSFRVAIHNSRPDASSLEQLQKGSRKKAIENGVVQLER